MLIHDAAAREIRLGEVHDAAGYGGGGVDEGFFAGEGCVGAVAGGALVLGGFEGVG